MVSITALPNDLNPHCKNVHHYPDNTFFHYFYFIFLHITRRYRFVSAPTASIVPSFFFFFFFIFLFSTLGSSVLILHISEMRLPIIFINHEISENPLILIITYQKYSSLHSWLRLLGRVMDPPYRIYVFHYESPISSF